MRTPARLLGHAIHPMLITLPVGLFSTAVVFDLVQLISGNETFSQVGFWNITAGLIGAVLAAAAGVIDWTSIPGGTRAKSVGTRHGLLNATAVILFIVAWLFRLDRPGHAPGGVVFVLEVIALGIAGVAAWLGGELTERHGIGIDEDARPDAPGSLRGGRTGLAARVGR